jgi:hypothetical protein
VSTALALLYVVLVVGGVVAWWVLRRRGLSRERLGSALAMYLVLVAVSFMTAYSANLVGPECGPSSSATLAFGSWDAGSLTSSQVASCVDAGRGQVAVALLLAGVAVVAFVVRARRATRAGGGVTPASTR